MAGHRRGTLEAGGYHPPCQCPPPPPVCKPRPQGSPLSKAPRRDAGTVEYTWPDTSRDFTHCWDTAMSPNGRLVATAFNNGAIEVYELPGVRGPRRA